MTTYIPSLTLPSSILSSLPASILLPVLAGSLIGFGTRPGPTQRDYLELKLPPLRPPPWLFGPTWVALYGMMGYASHRAWTIGTSSLNPQTVALTKVFYLPF